MAERKFHLYIRILIVQSCAYEVITFLSNGQGILSNNLTIMLTFDLCSFPTKLTMEIKNSSGTFFILDRKCHFW